MCKFIGGHRQIGARSFEDGVAVNAEEIFVEVAMERPSLQVELIVTSSLGHCKSALVFMALRAIDIPVLMSSTFLIGFAVPRRAVNVDVEDHATLERQGRDLLGEGFGEGLRRALGFRVRILLQDGLEGCSGASTGVQHVDRRRELVGDLIGEGMDISHLVSEFAPQGVLVRSGGVGEPKG